MKEVISALASIVLIIGFVYGIATRTIPSTELAHAASGMSQKNTGQKITMGTTMVAKCIFTIRTTLSWSVQSAQEPSDYLDCWENTLLPF